MLGEDFIKGNMARCLIMKSQGLLCLARGLVDVVEGQSNERELI